MPIKSRVHFLPSTSSNRSEHKKKPSLEQTQRLGPCLSRTDDIIDEAPISFLYQSSGRLEAFTTQTSKRLLTITASKGQSAALAKAPTHQEADICCYTAALEEIPILMH